MRFAPSLLIAALLAVAVLSQWAPSKPEWPNQFDAPFGLNVHILLYFNRTSHFYYNRDSRITRIKYHDGCLPLVTRDNCDLIFNDVGTWLLAPEDNNNTCCLLFKGIGSIPPAFLAPFNYTDNTTADDYYGTSHNVYKWSGPMGFEYWTDTQSGNDVQFKDGTGDTYWNWGNFNNVNQPASIFTLPSKCTDQCKLLDEKQRQHARKVLSPLLDLHEAHFGQRYATSP
jgi:hypothetical protein